MKYLFIILISFFYTSCVGKIKSGFYSKNDSIIFACDDVVSVTPYQNKKGIIFVDIKFSQKGLNKICNFTKNNIGKKYNFKVNKYFIATDVFIREAISCNQKGISPSPMIFNTVNNVYLFKESVCID